MDIVIPLQMAPNDAIELRYVLRSLRFVDHDQVWLSGWAPRWAKNVRLARGKRHGNRYADSLANLMRVARHPDCSDTFVYLADDIFAMKPNPPFGPWHRGRIHEKVLEYRLPPNRKKQQVGHRHGVAQTCAVLNRIGFDGHPNNYELHLPFVFDRDLLIHAVDAAQAEASVPALQPRTLYGNLYHHDAPELPADVKISSTAQLPDPDWSWVSTSDHSFTDGRVGAFLRQLHPDPSPYE